MADPGFTNGGGKDEAPQPPREVGCWEGCPLPRGLGRGDADSPEKKFDFGSENGDFRCILDFL